jgi:hypothetical protein
MIHYVDMATFRQTVPTSLSITAPLEKAGRSGSTAGQRRYQTSWRTKGFATPLNFESNLSVRDLMWPAKRYKSTLSFTSALDGWEADH